MRGAAKEKQRKDPVRPSPATSRKISTGTLGVSHGPDATPARLMIDGRDAGYTPVLLEVTAGKHRVRLSWPDGKVFERVVAVGEGEVVKSIGFDLTSSFDAPKNHPSHPPHPPPQR